MANGGWYGTKQEWGRIEAPILTLDSAVKAFANKHRLEVVRNHKDWPDRSIRWGGDVRCLIQLYLHNSDSLGVNLWICASQDRDGQRFWKNEMLLEDAPAAESVGAMPQLLEEARTRLLKWASEPATFELATFIR